MSDNTVYALLVICAFGFMSIVALSLSDKGAFEHCREKHSKQVCINILQEAGK